MWSLAPRQCPTSLFFFGLLLAICFECNCGRVHAQQSDHSDIDIVQFRDGDRLSGRLLSADKDSIVFSAKVTGNVRLSWKDVAEIDLPDRQVKLFTSDTSGGITLTTSVIAFYDSSLHLRRAATPLKDLPLKDLNSIAVSTLAAPEVVDAAPAAESVASAPTESSGGFGPIGGQFKISPDSIVRATQKQINLAGALDLGIATKSQEAFRHQETSLSTEANYTDSRKPAASAVVTALFSGNLQHDIFLRDSKVVCANCPNPGASDGLFVYGIANGYHNLSLGVNIAQSYGGGIGWQGDHGASSYSFMGDVRYFREDLYSPGASLSGAEAGLSEQYSYTFSRFLTGVNIYERLLFLPVFSNAKAFQVRGSSGIGVPITPNFSVDVDVLDDYLRNAPAGALQNYNKVIFSVKYTIIPKAPAIH